jgi:hypothetical protein
MSAIYTAAPRAFLAGVVAAALVMVVPEPVLALPVFGPPVAINPNAALDPDELDVRDDEYASIDGDGAGSWVVIWRSRDTLSGVQGSSDLLFSRSADDGATWSVPAVLNPDAAEAHPSGQMDVVYGNGVWVASWSGLVASAHRARVSRSTDGGVTWSAPIDLAGSSGFGYAGISTTRLATDGAGRWVAVWAAASAFSDPTGDDTDLYYSYSTDDALTWAADATFNSDAFSDNHTDSNQELAMDSTGNAVVAWEKVGVGVRYSSSADAGATWTAAQTFPFSNALPRVRLAHDGSGKWIAMLPQVVDEDLEPILATSTDGGLTWSSFVNVAPSDEKGGTRFAPDELIVDENGVWHLFGTGGSKSLSGSTKGDGEVLAMRSFDEGATWSSYYAYSPVARLDKGGDGAGVVAYRPGGKWLSLYFTTDTLDGTIGQDWDIVSSVGREICSQTALNSCKQSAEPGRSKLTVLNRPDGRDVLNWSWKRGEETLIADLGNPVTTADYAVCVYDQNAATETLVIEMHAASGGLCKGDPCWEATSDSVTYRDGRRENGSIRALQLRAGEAGRAQLKLRAKGAGIAPPMTPFAKDPSLEIQVVNTETGACWSSTFSTATKNDAGRFSAKSD